MAQPILIVGAGISGLTLAQACRKEGIPFRIFERDASFTPRSPGWGITLDWTLPTFRALLPDDISSRLPETYVNSQALYAGETGTFAFFDLSTGEARWQMPASQRIRVCQERLRRLLLTGINVEWNKNLINIVKNESGVNAVFYDGTYVLGSFLVGCDGAYSIVRRMIHPFTSNNYQLPICFLSANVVYPKSQVHHMRQLDPYLLQGSDPWTDAFLCFSLSEAPGDYNAPYIAETGEQAYRCQVMISWPYREGFFGRAEPTNIPNTDIGQRSWMKALAANWAEPFRSIVQGITMQAEIEPVSVIDWVPQRNSEEVFDGRVALLGDAAHTMVMYRDEQNDHAIIDVWSLLEQLRPLYKSLGMEVSKVEKAFKDAVDRYENEVVNRTEIAVLASRQACLDAHNFSRQDERSPLIRKLMRMEQEDGQG
jgi:2-polyprenyl-6-methoxyphenol hydroxylase-like FAD-dependent oxidoreductase